VLPNWANAPFLAHPAVGIPNKDPVRRPEKEPGIHHSSDGEQRPLERAGRSSVTHRLGRRTIDDEVSVLGKKRPRPVALHAEGRYEAERLDFPAVNREVERHVSQLDEGNTGIPCLLGRCPRGRDTADP
jgi:hypothetical protein